ncbi:hypothetical protein HMP0721_1918 [Pseudoramibacter alactolyticus ATCC 23263]|uniref:Uncharacterized protein n=1 Tax=Pseudoramibacter alactolyticus ATCC 23263 TaxID=887929 RepID=E6MIT3_9FIRM|nr:hypothetical protein HMP0721_1918 [Pseudoramibacter alactolyticus ATCC 23263]
MGSALFNWRLKPSIPGYRFFKIRGISFGSPSALRIVPTRHPSARPSDPNRRRPPHHPGAVAGGAAFLRPIPSSS